MDKHVQEEERSEVLIATNGLMYRFLLKEKFKILGCAMNRQGKSLDAIEERMQSANKVFWWDILVCKRRCAVENQVQKIGGPCVFRLLLRE